MTEYIIQNEIQISGIKKPHLSGSFTFKLLLKMVGAVGFEPTTPWSQTRCATKLRHTPSGVDEGARTLDNRNHNPGLYQLSYNHHNNFLDSTTSNDLNGAPDRDRTCDHPLRRRMLYPTELQAHYLRSKIIGKSRLEELVGAVGFEPTTPWSQTRCATKLRHTPIHLSFCTVQCIVRYGVHSRRDARRRQHLSSKKIKKTLHMYIYQAFQWFFIQF